MFYTYNKSTFESSANVSKDEVINYLSSLINRSHFTEAIDYIGRLKLPAITFADEFNLSIMEQFIKLLIFQGYHLKTETILEKTKTRALDLYLTNENKNLLHIFIKLSIWDSVVKQNLKRPYPSVPIFECLDNYFDLIDDNVLKAQILLQASHLHEFIGSQENFLKEAYKLILKAPRSLDKLHLELQIMNSLGVFYGLIGEVSTCKEILEECITKAKDLGDKRRVAGSMINLANIYYFDFDQTPETQLLGRNMIQESIKISEEIECVEYETIGNLILAEYYFKRGKSSQSLPYYQKVYDLQTKRGILSNKDEIMSILQYTQSKKDEPDDQVEE